MLYAAAKELAEINGVPLSDVLPELDVWAGLVLFLSLPFSLLIRLFWSFVSGFCFSFDFFLP